MFFVMTLCMFLCLLTKHGDFRRFPESFVWSIPIKEHIRSVLSWYQRPQNGNKNTPETAIAFQYPCARKYFHATKNAWNIWFVLQGVMGNIPKFRTCCACLVFPAKKIGICFVRRYFEILRFKLFFWTKNYFIEHKLLKVQDYNN